jgi:phage N-6-adenine-methyltransferase
MDVHYSSKNHTWETPQDFFDKLDSFFTFTLDSCAEEDTAKCISYYTKEDDALVQDWKADENFDTGIVKTIEWYLKKYGING